MSSLWLTLSLILFFAPWSDGVPKEPGSPAQRISITIFKERRELWVFRGEKVVKVYRIHLGGSPEGDKTARGDNRTPEGGYRVVEKKAQSKFHRFIGISFPNLKDADRAYNEGRITADDWVEILYATEKRTKPPWDTALGGYIGIHGIGENESFKRRLVKGVDWTNGCIAVTNKEIEELFRIVPLGAPVHIRK